MVKNLDIELELTNDWVDLTWLDTRKLEAEN